MRTVLIICILTGLAIEAHTQSVNGIIEFRRKTNWIEIMSKLPFMTQEEIDRNRLTWGRSEGMGEPYQLFFNGQTSVYIKKDEVNEYGYSWGDEDYLVIRDYKNKTMHDQRELLGRTYVIKEDIPATKWKILNEIKEVAGYLCMKAETIDPVADRVIHAWFTDQIPVFGGPEGYSGLPGMILQLEINNGDAVIEAVKVTILDEPVDLPIPKRIKGRDISLQAFLQEQKEFYETSIEGRKNPWWNMRY